MAEDWQDYSINGEFERAVAQLERASLELCKHLSKGRRPCDSSTQGSAELEPDGCSHGCRLAVGMGADTGFACSGSSLEAQQAYLLGLGAKPFATVTHSRAEDAFGNITRQDARWLLGASHSALTHARALMKSPAVPTGVAVQLFEPSRGASIGIAMNERIDKSTGASFNAVVRSKCDTLRPEESGGGHAAYGSTASGGLTRRAGGGSEDRLAASAHYSAQSGHGAAGVDLARARNVERLFVYKLMQQRRDHAMRLPRSSLDGATRAWLVSKPAVRAHASYLWFVPVDVRLPPPPATGPDTEPGSSTPATWFPGFRSAPRPAPFSLEKETAKRFAALSGNSDRRRSFPSRIPAVTLMVQADFSSLSSTNKLLTRHSDDALSWADASHKRHARPPTASSGSSNVADSSKSSLFWAPGSTVKRSLLLCGKDQPFLPSQAATTTLWSSFREAELGHYDMYPSGEGPIGATSSPPSLMPMALYEATLGAVQAFDEDVTALEQAVSLRSAAELDAVCEELDAAEASYSALSASLSATGGALPPQASALGPTTPSPVLPTPVPSPQAEDFLPEALGQKNEAARSVVGICDKLLALCDGAVAQAQQLLERHGVPGLAKKNELEGSARPYPSLSAALQALCGVINPTKRWYGDIPAPQGEWLKQHVRFSSPADAQLPLASDDASAELTTCRPERSVTAACLNAEVAGRRDPLWKVFELCDTARVRLSGGQLQAGDDDESDSAESSALNAVSLQSVWSRARETARDVRRILDLPPSSAETVPQALSVIASVAALQFREGLLSFKGSPSRASSHSDGHQALAALASSLLSSDFLPILQGNPAFASLVRVSHAEMLELEASAGALNNADTATRGPLPVATLLMRQSLSTFLTTAWSSLLTALRRLWDDDFLQAQEALAEAPWRTTGDNMTGVGPSAPNELAKALRIPVPPFALNAGQDGSQGSVTHLEESLQALACSWQALQAQKSEAASNSNAPTQQPLADMSEGATFATPLKEKRRDLEADDAEEDWFDPPSDVDEAALEHEKGAFSSPLSSPRGNAANVSDGLIEEDDGDEGEPLPGFWGHLLEALLHCDTPIVLQRRGGTTPDASSLLSPGSLRTSSTRVTFTVEGSAIPEAIATAIEHCLAAPAQVKPPPFLLPRPPLTSAQVANDDKSMRSRFGCHHDAPSLRVKESVEALRPVTGCRVPQATPSVASALHHPPVETLRGDMRAFALYNCDAILLGPSSAQPERSPGASALVTPSTSRASQAPSSAQKSGQLFLLDFLSWYYLQAGRTTSAPASASTRYSVRVPASLGGLVITVRMGASSPKTVLSVSVGLPLSTLAAHSDGLAAAREATLSTLLEKAWLQDPKLSLWADQWSSAIDFVAALQGKGVIASPPAASRKSAAASPPALGPSVISLHLLRQALQSSSWKPGATGETALESLQHGFSRSHVLHSLLAATIEAGAAEAVRLTRAADAAGREAAASLGMQEVPEIAPLDRVESLALDVAPSVGSLPLSSSGAIDQLHHDVRYQRLENAQRALRAVRQAVAAASEYISRGEQGEPAINLPPSPHFSSPALKGRRALRLAGEDAPLASAGSHAPTSLYALCSNVKVSARSCLQAVEACLVTATAVNQRQVEVLTMPVQVTAAQLTQHLEHIHIQASPLSAAIGDPLAFAPRDPNFRRASVLPTIAALSDATTAATRRLAAIAMLQAAVGHEREKPVASASQFQAPVSVKTASAIGVEGSEPCATWQLGAVISGGESLVPWHPGWCSKGNLAGCGSELSIYEPEDIFPGGRGLAVPTAAANKREQVKKASATASDGTSQTGGPPKGRKREVAVRLAAKGLNKLGLKIEQEVVDGAVALLKGPPPGVAVLSDEADAADVDGADEQSLDGAEVGSVDDDVNEATARWEDDDGSPDANHPTPPTAEGEEVSSRRHPTLMSAPTSGAGVAAPAFLPKKAAPSLSPANDSYSEVEETWTPSALASISSMHRDCGHLPLTCRPLKTPAGTAEGEDAELFAALHRSARGGDDDWNGAWVDDDDGGSCDNTGESFSPPTVPNTIGEALLSPLRTRMSQEALELFISGHAVIKGPTSVTAHAAACRKKQALDDLLPLPLREAFRTLGVSIAALDVSRPSCAGNASAAGSGGAIARNAASFRSAKRAAVDEAVRLYCVPRSPISDAIEWKARAGPQFAPATATAFSRYPPLEVFVSGASVSPSAWPSLLCALHTGQKLDPVCLDMLAPSAAVRVWKFESNDTPPHISGFTSPPTAESTKLSQGNPEAGTAWDRVERLDLHDGPEQSPCHTMTSVCSAVGTLALGQTFTCWH